MATDPQNRSALKDFLGSISSIKGDLSSITAPPFILADRSATEYPSSWSENPAILVAPALEKDPLKRALLVLKWYISSLKRQQYAGGDEGNGLKKPLNPFLGELFIGEWNDEAGSTKLVSEQVSHHPPVTACFISNEKHGVFCQGYTAQVITLSKTATVTINQVGHAVIHINEFDEDHLVTLPALTIKGILTGSLYPELSGKVYISSSSGFISEIDFSGKSFGFGKKNCVDATLYRANDRKTPLYEVSGQWNDKFTFKDLSTGQDVETVDTNTLQPAELSVAPVEQQDPWETRRAWAKVIEGLHTGDMKAVGEEKSKIENAQRDVRAAREKNGEKFEPKFFSLQQSDAHFEQLATAVGEDFGYERTGGVWKYDKQKASQAKKPFYGESTPLG